MPVEVTVRHMNVSDTIQAYARSKAEELSEDFPRIEHVHVIIDREKRNKVVSVVVQARNHVHVEAEEAAENLRAAIDVATEKAERQLRKLRDKVQEHRPKPAKVKETREGEDAEEFEGGVL
jgi:putative sigma-54 modulation protein